MFHSFYTILKIIQFSYEGTIWDSWKQDNLAYIEDGMADKLLPNARLVAISLVVLGLIIDILCAKWRSFARVLFHIEMLQFCMLNMVPL